MIHNRICLCLGIALCFLVSLTYAENKRLTVGIYDNPPLVFLQADQSPGGFFIDILEEVSRHENWKLQFRYCHWSECLQLLKEGKIDILPAIAYSEARAGWAIFTDETVLVNWAVVCRAANAEFETLPELQGLRVAVLQDDIFLKPFRSLVDTFDIKVELVELKSYSEILKAVSEGRAEAGVLNRLFLLEKLQEHPNIKPTPIVFSPVKIKFALPKTQTSEELRQALDSHLRQMLNDKDSVYYSALSKWFGVGPETPPGTGLFGLVYVIMFLVFIAVILLLFQRSRIKSIVRLSRQRERTIRALYEAIPDIVFRLKRDGTIVDYKTPSEELLFRPPEEFMGRTFKEVLPAEAAERISETLEQVFKDGIARTVRYALTMPKGIEHFEARLVVHSDDEAIAIIRNITEEVRRQEKLMKYQRELEGLVEQKTRALEQRVREVERLNRALVNILEDLRASNSKLQRLTSALRSSNEELEAFAYSISHDLRAPLRAIEGFTEIIIEDYGEALGQQGLAYAQRALNAARKMDRLIEDILQFSRMARAEPLVTMVDLERVVQEAFQTLEEEIRAKGARVQVKDPMPKVKGSHSLVLRAVQNLLSNAIKFVPEGRRPDVRLWAEEVNDKVRLYVQDNGIGIPAERINRIFGLFERLHGEETYPGTGVGLAIVRKAMEKIGGSVGCESSPGRGSTFWLEMVKYKEVRLVQSQR